jgi:hypothetical protein
VGKQREELQMAFVEVRAHPVQLLSHMADMRIWRGIRDIETAGFTHDAPVVSRAEGHPLSRVAPSLPRTLVAIA